MKQQQYDEYTHSTDGRITGDFKRKESDTINSGTEQGSEQDITDNGLLRENNPTSNNSLPLTEEEKYRDEETSLYEITPDDERKYPRTILEENY